MTPAPGRSAAAPRWYGAAELPGCLGDLSRPPAGLWLLGDAGALEGAPKRHVAIVGTREASPYGERTAARLATACTRAGLVVVSGLARGVDSVAHRAALAAGGSTVAVQGTGVDVPYPVGHRSLHAELSERGTVISEMEPGARAMPGCFPRRNRLIAALCEVTVVVEAGFKSGAVNTASQALELGRTVAAVPGPIDEPRSAGCNLLIRDGAQVITDVDDLLALFGLSTKTTPGTAAGTRAELGSRGDPGDESAVLGAIRRGAASAEQIAMELNVPIRHVFSVLLNLEMLGLISRDGGQLVLHTGREGPHVRASV